MVLSMCIIYYGKAVCSEASVQIMSRLDSLQFSVLTKHSSRRAGRAMIIISFLTSWHTNILITVFSMYLWLNSRLTVIEPSLTDSTVMKPASALSKYTVNRQVTAVRDIG
uniref:Uncharacterized protein n=1 Tax=Cyprinus carpio carpio TaxID=630221 RepID=A0A9J7X2G1_CYPCA